MSYTSYKLLILIPPDNEITLDEIEKHLRARFERRGDVRIERKSSTHIEIFFGDWRFHVYWQDEPSVVIESQEIANVFAKSRQDQEIIASCRKRITTAGSLDPNMAHFNDYLSVYALLESLENVYMYDEAIGELWKSGEPAP